MQKEPPIRKLIDRLQFDDLWIESALFDYINIKIDPGTTIRLSDVHPFIDPQNNYYHLTKEGVEVLQFERFDEVEHAWITIGIIQYVYWRKGKYQSRCVEEE